jgi:DNA-binding response OmpR family regulator
MRVFADQTTPPRVALLADQWLNHSEWERRGLAAFRPRALGYERMLVEPPDAIVLGVPAEEPGGVEECWRLHDLTGVPILVVADPAGTGAVVRLLERGADDVLTGEPTTAEVAAHVAAVLRRTRPRGGERMPGRVRIGDIEVDTQQRVVRRPDRVRPLSRTEYRLLLTLLRAAGRPCTNRQLMASAWGAGCSTTNQHLRLCIRRLRQKIEDDARRPRYLLNVWGIGYRLTVSPGPAQEATDPPAQRESMISPLARHPDTATDRLPVS